MKTFSNVTPSDPRGTFRILRPLVAAAFLASLGAAAPPTEPKTHILFMGVDFSVPYHKEYYRVENVVGGSFVIHVDGKEVKVPADWGAISIKVDRSLKLTATSVAIDHLKAERAYTPANDPTKKFMREQSEMLAAQDAVASAASNYGNVQVTANAASRGAAASPGGAVQGIPTQSPVLAERDFNAAAATAQAGFGRSIDITGNYQEALAKELYDAIDVEFEIAEGMVLARPYVVVLAEYKAANSKPGESSNWLYATALDPLDGKARKVRIREGGFPPGYQLQSYQVHLYDGGVEVATTVSDKRVPLTHDEAFAYLLIEYLGSHKGASLPAAPIMGKLSPEEAARLNADQLRHKYYVKVSKDGLPLAAFADADLSTPADAAVISLVGKVRFYPALDHGKPVGGVAELRFPRLAL